MFVDDRPIEVLSQWQKATCKMHGDSSKFHLLPVEVFDTKEKTLELVIAHQPKLIFIGFGLSSSVSNGADVIRYLYDHNYSETIVANSGGSIEQFAREEMEFHQSVGKSSEKLSTYLDEYLIFHSEVNQSKQVHNYTKRGENHVI